MQSNRLKHPFLPVMLSIGLAGAVVGLPGCERSNPSSASTRNQPADQTTGADQPLGRVSEFDDFTLRANVIPTEFLPEAMANLYGIEAQPARALLNLVIMDKRPDQQPAAVAAKVNAQYESLIGHVEVIAMRAVEADGHVSYIGTLDTSAQRIFRFVIDAQPAGIDQPLQMEFEAQLPTLDTE